MKALLVVACVLQAGRVLAADKPGAVFSDGKFVTEDNIGQQKRLPMNYFDKPIERPNGPRITSGNAKYYGADGKPKYMSKKPLPPNPALVMTRSSSNIPADSVRNNSGSYRTMPVQDKTEGPTFLPVLVICAIVGTCVICKIMMADGPKKVVEEKEGINGQRSPNQYSETGLLGDTGTVDFDELDRLFNTRSEATLRDSSS